MPLYTVWMENEQAATMRQVESWDVGHAALAWAETLDTRLIYGFGPKMKAKLLASLHRLVNEPPPRVAPYFRDLSENLSLVDNTRNVWKFRCLVRNRFDMTEVYVVPTDPNA